MCMSQAWENALWALMCQERLGILMTIMEGQQLKGMYLKNKRCGLKTLNILRKDTSDRTCHRMMQSCWKNLVFVVSSWVVKLPGADPFMEWTVETVLPREVWKLASAIEEKDAELAQRDDQIEALEFTNEEHQQKILRLNEEMNDLVVNRPMSRRGYFDNELCFIKKNSKNVHPYYVIRCQYRQLEKHKSWLRLRYPNMEVADECDDPNAIHRWCRFKREVIKKPNYYKNHFSLTEEKRALLQTALDVNI